MTRTQIQLPEPLFIRIKQIAAERDYSVAEVMRRAAEAYIQTMADTPRRSGKWAMPVLKKSGGYVSEPSHARAETMVIEKRSSRK